MLSDPSTVGARLVIISNLYINLLSENLLCKSYSIPQFFSSAHNSFHLIWRHLGENFPIYFLTNLMCEHINTLSSLFVTYSIFFTYS